MLTEQTVRDYPMLVKAMTGIPAEHFWEMMETIEARYADYERQRHARDERHRAVGGGRTCDLPLVMRVTMLLFSLRTHIPQTLVALLCGGTPSDVSRDLRRLLPLLREVLPTPAIWNLVEEPASAPADESHTAESHAAETQEAPVLDRITQPHVLGDATEQEVARSQDSATRKR
jgi:hypothetical protein